VPPANPTLTTATAATAWIDNDYLGLHRQVIDLNVISLGDSQWHGIRNFGRDSPTDRPDAGNSNDGARQDIREHRTATHCSHEFSPSFECFLRALQKPQHLYLSREVVWPFATLRVIQPPCIEAYQTYALSINRGIHPRRSGFLPINSRARRRHHMPGRSPAVPDCGSREYIINAD
jgi:hypothetical protein